MGYCVGWRESMNSGCFYAVVSEEKELTMQMSLSFIE